MDLHILPGVTSREVAEAHRHDVRIQDEFCCKTMTYWIDESRGHVFCLIEAPDRDAVREMHKKAHGLVPNEIIEVNSGVVESFLGRIRDPDSYSEPEANLKVFSDPAFRVILVSKTMDARLLQRSLGKEKAQELLVLYNSVMHEQVSSHDGREVERREEGFVISFVSAAKAVACALAVQKRLHVASELIGLRIGLHAGVPVAKNDSIFGATIGIASYLCGIGKDNRIILSSVVRNLYKEHDVNLITERNHVKCLTAPEETFLETLVSTLNERWQDPQFGVPDFCTLMSISKPQLYRKCIAITGMSPNTLLREYRLQRSLELLRSEEHNVAQTTFDTGFSSPSYFTKCFQKRFGVQPLTYLKARL
jgi:AraC-like DNA-binding protein